MHPILVFLGMLWFHFYFFWQFFLYFLFYILYSNGYGWVLVPFLAAYISWVALSNSQKEGTNVWYRFTKSWVIEGANKYFPIQLIRTEPLDWRRQYIFAVHPHGMMPWSLHPIGKGEQWSMLFPGIMVRALAASIIFRIPFAREVTLWIGGVDAGRTTAQRSLEQGFSLAITVGGSEELLESYPGTEVVVLKKRKGFVRLALHNGADLVPVYVFGANELYRQMPWFKDRRKWLLEKTKIAFTFATGNSKCLLLPARIPLYAVVGKPIPVDRTPEPTEEQINQLHAQYIDAVVSLFEKEKKKYGYGERELTVN